MARQLAEAIIALQRVRVATVNGHASVTRAALSTLVFVALAACGNEGGRFSLEEGLKCASDGLSGRPGTFNQAGNAIAYSYESPNGPATGIVTFLGSKKLALAVRALSQ